MFDCWTLCICLCLMSLEPEFETHQCRLLWCHQSAAELCLTYLVQVIEMKAGASSTYFIPADLRLRTTPLQTCELKIERDEVQASNNNTGPLILDWSFNLTRLILEQRTESKPPSSLYISYFNTRNCLEVSPNTHSGRQTFWLADGGWDFWRIT